MRVLGTPMPMEMAPDQDPEITPTPKDLLKALKFGTPQEFDAAIKFLNEPDMVMYQRPTILKEKVKKNVEA